VRDRAADRSAIPHLLVADDPGRLREHRTVLPHDIRFRDRSVRGHRTNLQTALRGLDSDQLRDAADVDERCRRGQAELHSRCTVLTVQADGSAVTTIEGLATNGKYVAGQ